MSENENSFFVFQLIRHSTTHLSDDVKRKQRELLQLKQMLHQKEEELQQIVKKEEDYKSFLVAQGRYGVIPSLINVGCETKC